MRLFRIVLSLASMLASAWLFVMYLRLRHPGFEARAGLALLFAAASALLLAHAWRPGTGRLFRGMVLVAALFLAWCGGSAIVTNHRSAAGFEGFADIIGTAFLLQALLVLGPALASRPGPSTRTGAAALRT